MSNRRRTRRPEGIGEWVLVLFGPIIVVVAVTALVLWAGLVLLSQPHLPPAIVHTAKPAATMTLAPITPPTPTISPTAVPTTVPPAPSPTPITGTVTPTLAAPIPTRPTATPAVITPTAAPPITPTVTAAPSTVVLDKENTDRYTLAPGALLHAHGLIVLEGNAYAIDAGQLVVIPLEGSGPAQRLSPPQGQIDGLSLGELTALSLDPSGTALLLLDKRGDLYRFVPQTTQWSVERPIDQRRTTPNPVPLAVAAYNGRIYLLDEGYSQVWRYPFGEDVEEGYLPGDTAPWSRVGTAFDLTRGIDLAVDGDVFVLLREGNTAPAGLARFTGPSPERVTGFTPELELPTKLTLDPAGEGFLYVIDQAGKRLRALDRETGTVVQTYTFADEAVEMRAVYVQGGQIYIAAVDQLYRYPGSGQQVAVPGGEGPVPDGRPDNAGRLQALGGMIQPIEGLRHMPERDSLLPGAPRVYRYGIHRGWDNYGGLSGIDIAYGTPVRAVAAGVVVRADHGYQEVTPAQWRELAAVCAQQHQTPPEILDRFRGRQVWIEHDDGLVTRYVHLSGIPREVITGTAVLQGQTIGYVGNSGTSDGAAGNQQGAHLHFEITLDGQYLGQWLSLVEVRRLLQRLFFP